MVMELKEALREALSKIGKENFFEASLAFLYWDEVAGEKLSERVRPQFVRGKTLFVTAASVTWAQELQFFKPKLLRALNARLGKKFLTDIKTTNLTVNRSGSGLSPQVRP